ncbi:uncharacterized protein TNCV_1665951 [Trichonephila clavipes]|nr:uncharacterized protein TNCV_1665951 [Trichonephila clavipes]
MVWKIGCRFKYGPRLFNEAQNYDVIASVIDVASYCDVISPPIGFNIYDSYCSSTPGSFSSFYRLYHVAAVAEWYRYRIVACLVTSSIPVPLKTRRVGQRCTLNLSRAETSSRWCGVVVRRGGCQLRCRPRHLTMVQNYVVRRQKPSCS